MNRIRFCFARKKMQMAQLHDLKRQLQEAQDECDTLGDHLVDSWDKEECLREHLHRVARERDQEREKRMEAEDLLFDRYMDDYDWAYNELMSAVEKKCPNETRHEMGVAHRNWVLFEKGREAIRKAKEQ